MNYSGIDLHSNNSVVSVIDETDRVVAEKRLPNDMARILAFLAPWRAELAGVVVESTYNWYWLVNGLQAAGFVVHLANITAIKKYDGLKHTGDETDARYLAHLLRLGILPTGAILSAKHREVRDLASPPALRVVGRTGFEPVTNGLKVRCSTAELTARATQCLSAAGGPCTHLADIDRAARGSQRLRFRYGQRKHAVVELRQGTVGVGVVRHRDGADEASMIAFKPITAVLPAAHVLSFLTPQYERAVLHSDVQILPLHSWQLGGYTQHRPLIHDVDARPEAR